MKVLSLAVAVASVSIVPALAWACPGANKADGVGCGQHAEENSGCGQKVQEASVRDISIPQLASVLKTGAHEVAVFDANNQKTRQTYGQIPGARALTSHADYDIARELPANKQSMLVFYCANTKCTASQTAARRALDAGYSTVYVLRDGIAGWLNAGQPVDVPQA